MSYENLQQVVKPSYIHPLAQGVENAYSGIVELLGMNRETSNSRQLTLWELELHQYTPQGNELSETLKIAERFMKVSRNLLGLVAESLTSYEECQDKRRLQEKLATLYPLIQELECLHGGLTPLQTLMQEQAEVYQRISESLVKNMFSVKDEETDELVPLYKKRNEYLFEGSTEDQGWAYLKLSEELEEELRGGKFFSGKTGSFGVGRRSSKDQLFERAGKLREQLEVHMLMEYCHH